MAKVIPINQRMLAKHRMKKYLKNGRETSERRAENIRTETADMHLRVRVGRKDAAARSSRYGHAAEHYGDYDVHANG